MRYTSDISGDFFPALRDACCESDANPLHVLAVMMSESGVRADAHNPRGHASGLIQFMPKTLMGLGWSAGHAAFRGLGATEQLAWCRKYFRPHRGRLPSIGAVYTAVFLPALLSHASDPAYVLTARDGQLGWAYGPNAVLDRDKDYRITVGELELAVRRNCVGARWSELVARLEGRESAPAPEPSLDLRTTYGVQHALARLGYDPGPTDGIPGAKTRSAITAFQRATPGLAVDGIYGPRTRDALSAALQAR